MASPIDAIRPGMTLRFEAPSPARAEGNGTAQRGGLDPLAPRIEDSDTSRRIKDGANAPGQMGPLSPAEHRIVKAVQESLEGSGVTIAAGGQAADSGARDTRRGGIIDLFA